MICVQIITSIAADAAGTSYAVCRLADTLGTRNIDSQIFSTGTPAEVQLGKALSRVFATDRVPLLGSVLSSTTLREALRHAAQRGAVLHCHGLWRMPNLYPAWAATRHNAPLVFSPQGMLARPALQYSSWRKQVFWSLAQKRALDAATCLHAASRPELDDIRAHSFTQPIALVPNGIDVPPSNHIGRKREPMRTLLQLGRLHPQKRVDRLIEAWARVESTYPDWQLRIVGPADGRHGEELKRHARRLGVVRIAFEGALFGAAKERAYDTADLFVSATENENFGLVIAEALAHGTPVITTTGAPWPGIVNHRCGWWIGHGVDALTAALHQAMALPRVALDEMGARGRAWMLAEFSWERAAADMEAVYRWCAGSGERPACVKN